MGRVINDLERCTCHVPDACRDCSKYAGGTVLKCVENLMMDALELLKERVAIMPTKFKKCNIRWEIVDAYRCGNCQHELDHVEKWSYCPKCGKAVKWDETEGGQA